MGDVNTVLNELNKIYWKQHDSFTEVERAIEKLDKQLTTICHQLEPVTNRNGLEDTLNQSQNSLTHNGWVMAGERLPTKEEDEHGIVGIVNGYNGNIRFTEDMILLRFNADLQEWWSEDYNIRGCKVVRWFPIPSTEK